MESAVNKQNKPPTEFTTEECKAVLAVIMSDETVKPILLVSPYNNKKPYWDEAGLPCPVATHSEYEAAKDWMHSQYNHFVFDLYEHKTLAAHALAMKKMNVQFTLLRPVLASLLPNDAPAWTIKPPDGTIEVFQVSSYSKGMARPNTLGVYADKARARDRQMLEILQLRARGRPDNIRCLSKAALAVNGKYYLVNKTSTNIIGANPV